MQYRYLGAVTRRLLLHETALQVHGERARWDFYVQARSATLRSAPMTSRIPSRTMNEWEIARQVRDELRLEERIQGALDDMYEAKNAGKPKEAAAHWCEVVRLIGTRSPGKVKAMEKERKL